MTVYILIFVLLLGCSIFSHRNIILFLLVFLLMLFVAGFRDISVGTDTENYYEIYEYLKYDMAPPWFTIEPGWKILNNFAIKLNAGYSFVVFFASLLTLIPIFRTAWKYSDRPFVSILFFYILFFYFQSFNAVRQMMAVAFVFSAYNDYLHEKKRLFYIQLCIALIFHYSAILGLFFPLVFKYINIKSAFVLLPITYILGIFIIPKLIPFLPLVGKYSVYLIGDIDAKFSIPRLLINCLCLFFMLASKNSNKNQLKLFVIGIICYNLVSFSEVAGRCALYFMISQIILFANIDCVHPRNKYFLNAATITYGIVYVSMLLSNNNGEILPYSNLLFSTL